ncbi:MAG: hypothetical protein GY783_14165 [Gammaproteobacteria bacterium]|nr:hypothetical protein [Gammaproteobacteria bacterium]
MAHANKEAWLGRVLAILIIGTHPAIATAQDYDIAIQNHGKAVVIEKGDADYPGGIVRRGQEGWVRASFVVTEDGRAIDPIIMDSSGGPGFEGGLVGSLDGYRFEPTAFELPNNVINFRHEIRRGRDAATSNFIRRTKRILTHLHNEEVEDARKRTDAAVALGGWNLYESTMLWLMVGRVYGAEGDHAGKLEMYLRALGMGNAIALPKEDRIELLEKIFLLQSHFDQYAAALSTARMLTNASGSEEAVARIKSRVDEMQNILANEDVVAARATIYNPCDCDEGQPLWHYIVQRRTFSFANLNGNVERFEARCENQRISGTIEPDQTWTLEPEWGLCRVIVFGEDGAAFDFLEHLQDNEGTSTQESAVARNHVLDQTS